MALDKPAKIGQSRPVQKVVKETVIEKNVSTALERVMADMINQQMKQINKLNEEIANIKTQMLENVRATIEKDNSEDATRPRIESISVEFDGLGHPKRLVPAYSKSA